LLKPGARVVVGVSGGPDSVALLALLAELRELDRLRLWGVYVDHGCRPGAARREAGFVRRLGQRLRVPIVAVAIPPRKRPRHSWEGTARAARYAALARVARRVRATAVAVGHTREDQAETVLLALLRGSGLQGLGGMPAHRALAGGALTLVRPLLGLGHRQLQDYLRRHRLPWVVDATNRQARFRRNWLRLRVFPLLSRWYGPGVVDRVTTCAALARDDEAYLALHVDRWCRRHARRGTWTVRVPRAVLGRQPIAMQRRVLRWAVRRVAGSLDGVTFRHVAALVALLDRGTGTAHLPGGVEATVTDGTMTVRRRRARPPLRGASCKPVGSMLH